MIPIALTFEAFGPFPGRQSIDFTVFDSERIFLISGMTGSGKTTIFDAICFCLYGTASGGLRETESFKSDFADEKSVCFAEFTFLVRGRRYTVRREPIQMRIKRGGNRVKDANSTASLTFEDGTSLTGPLNVTSRVEELLGITADQFKKIVMLPQGEFRRFLSDDSAKKQETLRKIFSTEILETFTERLRLNASAIRTELEQHLVRSRAFVEGILCEEGGELWTALSAAEPDIPYILRLLKEDNRRLRSGAARLRRELEALNKRRAAVNIPYAQELNRRFAQLEESRAALLELEAQQPHYAALEKRIALLKSVREIGVYEAAANRTEEELAGLTARQEAAAVSLAQDKAALAAAEEALTAAREAQRQIPTLVRETESWEVRVQSLSALEQAREKLAALSAEDAKLAREEQQLNTLRNAALLHTETAALTERLGILQKLREEILRCGELSRDFKEKSDIYQSAMNAFLNSQAYQLAGELRQDAPCPVCGSLSHPAPAQAPEVTATKEELEQAKECYEESSRLLKEQQGSCRQLLLGAGCDVKAHARLSAFLPEIEAEAGEAGPLLKQREAELAHLLNGRKPPAPEEVDRQLAERATQAAVNAEKRSALEAAVSSLAEKLPEGELTSAQAEAEITSLKQQITAREQAAEAAAAKRDALSGACARGAEALSQLSDRAAALEETLRQNWMQYRQMLAQIGMTAEEYAACRKDAGRLAEFEEDLESYRESLTRRRGVIESLEPQLKGKAPVNIEALQQEADLIQGEIDSAMQRYTAGSGRLQSNRERYLRLRESCRETETLSAAYGKAQKLYDVANGKYSDKVDFERYVLAGYFTEVIENANLRLAQMTGSRYTLNRRTEREKGNRSSGLSLEVFDAYTGKARHVNTLSGGESFKIALALALGLADIISQNSGGIELSTMFIDEGFGSLDQNSLESAIECLNNLRSSGRYIGIISHVTELKEKIPAKINVVQEPQGSFIQLQT